MSCITILTGEKLTINDRGNRNMSNDAQLRIEKLRALMRERNVDIYIVPTADYHGSEYVGEYFKCREYITGFTGSAGTALITGNEAYLWTDGRYFIQAESELEGSNVVLMRAGDDNVPTIAEFLDDNLKEGQTVGFDGRVVSANLGKKYSEIAKKHGAGIDCSLDLISEIWDERPDLPENRVWILKEEFSGESTASKIEKVREKMDKEGCDFFVLTSLYDIMWLLNLRGSDIEHVPVALSFVILSQNEIRLYINNDIIDDEAGEYLNENKVTLREYFSFYEDIRQLKNVMLSIADVSYAVYENVRGGCDDNLKNRPNPTELLKAKKNDIEIQNTIKAHIKDGVAVTKFMYWLKNNIGKIEITESDAADHIDNLRGQQEGFLDLSFDTISAYGANAAMMHYTAKRGQDAKLEPKGFLLVDSGAHYLEGTTDITRTFVLGELSEKQKKLYTAVLKGNLNLASAVFLYGCRGVNLDILARKPLWDMDLDYKCGTGHGVGHILNVHEGPNAFRWRVADPANPGAVLEENMITTDEPGVYLEGEFGIRIENELVCKSGEKNEYGQFMHFDTITYAPIDLDAVLPELMTEEERRLLNDYHSMVYEVISPYLTEDERNWLRENTRSV